MLDNRLGRFCSTSAPHCPAWRESEQVAVSAALVLRQHSMVGRQQTPGSGLAQDLASKYERAKAMLREQVRRSVAQQHAPEQPFRSTTSTCAAPGNLSSHFAAYCSNCKRKSSSLQIESNQALRAALHEEQRQRRILADGLEAQRDQKEAAQRRVAELVR